MQIIILRKNFKLENILQIPVSIVFGYFIDFTMYLLVWINPQHYFVKLIALIIGCIVLGFGVYIEILADVVMLPGESFVRAIVQTWNTNFGTTKIIFDSSMTIIARLFGKQLEFIKPHLFPEDYKNAVSEPETAASTEASDHKNVIVIGRQYGCGGHDLGKALAECDIKSFEVLVTSTSIFILTKLISLSIILSINLECHLE